MLSPEVAKKLMADVPEMREFVRHIIAEANKLNNLHDIKLEYPIPYTIEAKSRQKAYETLTYILSPLLDRDNIDIVANRNKDYEV